MTLTPRQAQARVDEARASLRAAERERDEAFAAWWKREIDATGRAHGVIARLASEAGVPDRSESVRQAVKRGRART